MKYAFAGSLGSAKTTKGAFSMVEMLAVIAVISIMMAMLAPAVKGFSETAGRRGAVNVVMNTLEQARVSALESGRDVYVLFYRKSFPNEDGLAVIRQMENDSGYEQVSRFQKLPKGVLLAKPGAGASLIDSLLSGSITLPQNLEASKMGVGQIAAIKFNASGQASTLNNAPLRLYISEGTRDGAGNESQSSKKATAGLPFDIVSIAKYTGRVELDVTTVAAN